MPTDGSDAANVINPGATETDCDGPRFEERSDGLPVEATVVPPTVEERLGHAVLRLRLFWGWSQRELQRRSGVHQSQISRLESGGKHGLSTRRLFAILRALRVGEIAFLPPVPSVPPTQLDVMLWGDPWERAGRAADGRRLNRRRSA